MPQGGFLLLHNFYMSAHEDKIEEIYMKCVYKHHCLELRADERLFLVSGTLFNCTARFFPKSVHILGTPVLYQLTCMVYDHGGP